MGRITSDVVRGMSVTQFIGVGHIASTTCADPEILEGGESVVAEIYEIFYRFAPALSLTRNRADK